MKGKRQTANTRKDWRHYKRILIAFLLMISLPVPRTDAATPTAASNEMKLFSYPKLGFQIRFPASWAVRDKSGDLVDGHWVEGRRSADTPSGLDDNKGPAMSKKEQQLADIAFLKGIRVTILVQDIEQQPVRKSLLAAVNNRIQGMKMMGKTAGDDVDIKPLERVQLATVPAFVTRVTTRHKRAAQISVTTIFYDFERGDRSYVIGLEAPADEFDEHAAEFARIVRSFTFIEAR
jgi:hypothetical protein